MPQSGFSRVPSILRKKISPICRTLRLESVIEPPFEELPGYLQALDAGIIPFRAKDPYVQGINPNKVYQYLASGLPVVTTPVLDLTPRPPHLQFADDATGFTSGVAAALGAPEGREARREMAREHDWSRLADRMVGTIEQELAARLGTRPREHASA